MATKAPGICGHCRETVSPNVIEENTFRRDKCQCPKCSEILYSCRTPGCDDYAKGGKSYDEELCVGCTKSLAEGAGTLAKGAITVLATAGAAYAASKFTESSEK